MKPKKWLASALLPVLASMSVLVAARAEAREKGLQPTRRELSRLEGAHGRSSPSPATNTDDANLWRRWYGWQVLLVDAVSIGALEAGALSHERGPVFLGLTTYLLGPPLVHLAHREGWRTGASFGVRVATPILAVAIAAASNPKLTCDADPTVACEDETRRNVALVFGGAMLVTSVADSFALAFRSQTPRPTTSAHFAPTFVLLPRWERGGKEWEAHGPGSRAAASSWGLTLAGTF